MSEALFITNDDLLKFTTVNAGVDSDKFVQYIKIAQDIHIQNYLGTALFESLKTRIEDDTISGDYLMLLTTYVKPMLIHWAMVEYLAFAPYTIANKGVFKHGSENSESVERREVNYMVEKERDIAQNYTRRFRDYICLNTDKFPEYIEYQNGQVYPDKQSDFGGWVL